MEKKITKAAAEKIARRLAEHYGEQYRPIPYEERELPSNSCYMGPWVFPGSHEESNSAWIISWEMCPAYEWAYKDAISTITREVAPGFYAEAINHLAVGFYEEW